MYIKKCTLKNVFSSLQKMYRCVPSQKSPGLTHWLNDELFNLLIYWLFDWLIYNWLFVGRDGALVESITFIQRVVGNGGFDSRPSRHVGKVLYLQLPVRLGVKLRYSIRADYFTDWFTDSFAYYVTDWFEPSDYLTDWLTNWLIDWLTDRLFD